MKLLTLSEVKQLELDILSYIHKLCQKHNLRYYLSYGTLLGAVRHKGFIPWDDDIDIMMPRRDYESLIKIMSESTIDERYKIFYYPNNKDYYYTHAKVIDNATCCLEKGLDSICGMGLWVDVFPLDGTSRVSKFDNYKIYFFHKMKALSVHKSAPKKNILLFPILFIVWKISRIIGYRKLLKCINRFGNYDFDDSEYISCLIEPDKPCGIYYPRTIFDTSILLPFEGEKFYVPSLYKKYLQLTYGEYMQLPAEDKRVSHGFEVYMK